MKGLPSNFQLTNGSFTLTDGVDKAYDRLLLFLLFDRFREAIPLFTPGILVMQQKPMSYLFQFQTILLGTISSKIAEYCPEILLLDIFFVQDNNDRKQIGIHIDFVHKPTNTKNFSIVFL